MRLTNLTNNHPWDLVLSKEDSQQPETWEKLKKLHILEEIKPGDRISTETGDITNNLGRLAKMFAGEYRVIDHTLADGNFKQELLRISPSSTANICHEIPASTEQLESQLNEHGHILIRTGQPLNEGKILELIGGTERLMNYKNGLNQRKKVPDSIFSDVTPWSKEEEILPHNELSHHTEFPKYVSFICKQPAQYGGETTIYDCQQAFANLSPSFQKQATEINVIFVRKHVEQRNHKKYDSSWQAILAKNSKDAIAYW
ncbi:TauD/TfdA family dioxygenase [Moorena producens JHB]|uniref:TauD/TfdA family dioxygenase n=1 Tax=Moorena producens (strain JHB) TaxID=1454205 RepID=A0A1D9FZB5_MOOP1|nr:TauD/TfdA family dioxygenase [Moorena producens]AOY80722.1 TauD/TfdA family dioxygenase [Moorena producens JHB]